MDIYPKLEIYKALMVLEIFGRELPADEALELYREIGTRQTTLRNRLSKEGVFRQISVVQHRNVVASANGNGHRS